MRLRTFILSVLLLGIFSAARAQTGNAPANAPKFFVRDYRFEGETILPPEKLSGILSNYTGTVDLPRIHAGLNKLQRFYELEGVTNLSVTLPQQTLTDGIVRVKIVPRPAQKNAALAAKPLPKLDITTYHIDGNTVLPPRDFGVLSNYTGTNVDFARLRAATKLEGLVDWL